MGAESTGEKRKKRELEAKGGEGHLSTPETASSSEVQPIGPSWTQIRRQHHQRGGVDDVADLAGATEVLNAVTTVFAVLCWSSSGARAISTAGP